ncbi:hypothetical protein X802_08505 [Thermococcus guaymasensis DSM 11113]|uniref:F5/8 type C domain-containing protein n=1 Tax=Thermococcus guaymasensis DSM 11113 TaxID=1432656 RepID=A0A0X1KNE3_9EURY|nr:hypothetical protein X802_08505 [Thermococcus guaymasensis DSM 11113]
MPVKELKGRKDFSHLNYTEVGSNIKPVKAEDTVDPETGSLAPILYSAVWDVDATQSQTVTLDTENRQLLEVYMRSTTSPTVHMDVSPDGVNWIEDVNIWSGYSKINEGFYNASRYVRIRTEPAGNAGDKVTIVIMAK